MEIDAGAVDAGPVPDEVPERRWYCHWFQIERGNNKYETRCYRTLYGCARAGVDGLNRGFDTSLCRSADHAYCYTVRNDVEEYRYMMCSKTLEHCYNRFYRLWLRETEVVTECVRRE